MVKKKFVKVCICLYGFYQCLCWCAGKLHRLHSFGAQISRFFMTKIHIKNPPPDRSDSFSGQVVESIHRSTTATAAPSDGSSADRRAGGKWTAQGRSKTWRWWKTSGIFHRFFYMVDIWWIKIRHEDIFCMKTMDYRLGNISWLMDHHYISYTINGEHPLVYHHIPS